MKLCKLKLRNLNSFRGEHELDFEDSPLAGTSLAAITGPTGAGKTTLLDAVCVALYGKTPRLAGIGDQHPRHLLSHGETDCHAEVHFIANGVRYLAEWSLRRDRSPIRRLLADGENSSSDEIEAILGLDFDAFKRSVMLAQGEFAAFLKATNEERRTILEAIAGVDIYDRLKDALNQKMRELESAHQEVLQRLSGIPDVTPEQLADSKNRLRDLQREAAALDVNGQQIQETQQRETQRTAWFSELEDARERNRELTDQQAEIATLEGELEQANRANHLRPEKQAFDTAKLELRDAEAALGRSEMELADAQRRFDANRTDFEEANRAYEAASIQHHQQTNDYNAARLDVIQATTRFTRAEESEEDLLALTERVESLSIELTEDNERYTALEAEVATIETFLADNQLPTDRQERLTSAATILAEHRIKQEQLTERSEAEAARTSDVSRLSTALERSDGELEEIKARKEASSISLADADAKLAALQEGGTLEEWGIRRQDAERVMPVALQYETTQNRLVQSEGDLQGSQDRVATLNSELERVKSQLAFQSQTCQDADEAVTRWTAERESVLLANPINHLRRHLRAGESCPVCGATEHPRVDDVDPEGTERLDNAENALVNAREMAGRVHARRETLEREEIRIKQDMSNITAQAEAAHQEIHQLKSEMQSTVIRWREIYPGAEVSSDWLNQQIRDADTAIEDLQKAHEAYTQASNLCQEISQQLNSFEQNLARERSVLDDAKQDLQAITNVAQDLNRETADMEARFRELLPSDFHGVELEEAVDQFADRIRTVGEHERQRDEKQNEMTQLSIGIMERQRSLETEQERHGRLETEIEGYRNEAIRFLDAAREKTGGPTTIDEINTAIEKLEETLQEKGTQRDEAEQLVQRTETVLTETRTNHSNHQARRTECSQKFETARNDFLERLSAAGFDSPEAHNQAFREEDWRQQTAEKIASHTREQQRLEVEIARLVAIFEENPFNPEALERITAQAEEIETQIREAQRHIGAQEQTIEELTDALSQREALGDEIRIASDELARWNNLQETMPRNDLRDFALDIMFKQVSRIANAQLEYLTLERYQLKVEGIGKLTIIDRWNANEERPVETLSGGESFLTSLALALALSELSRGRSQIHSLFLDEGFGTLDAETLDVAIAALEGLQMQGRSIFLISHIGELTRRIPVRIAVEKMGNGSSRLHVRG